MTDDHRDAIMHNANATCILLAMPNGAARYQRAIDRYARALAKLSPVPLCDMNALTDYILAEMAIYAFSIRT